MRLNGRRREGGGADWPEREALEAELVLLREENARMKVDAARPPGPGRAVERIRGVVAAVEAVPAKEPDGGDEAWHALAEATMLREVLTDMCEEVQGAIAAVQNRLQAAATREAAPHRHTGLGATCDRCGAPLRSVPGTPGANAPVPLRPAQAAAEGGGISMWEVSEG
jgi:hypothetical protein